MIVQDTETLFEHGTSWADVCVVVPLYNYATYITETLRSVASQDAAEISLVVVDDCSKDSSPAVVKAWLEENKDRFSTAILTRNISNAGLSITRNTGISLAQSPYIFFLDADNLLYPRCLSRHLEAVERSSGAQGAYSLLEMLDGDRGIMGTEVFDRGRLKYGNHIDAMALIRRDFLLKVGGYHDIKFGWEDFDLWLRMCEMNEFLVQIPEILGRYRVHHQSMLRTTTNVGKNHVALRENITALHPWLQLD
jgi:glycosyltransferase involved in cell wall biosynthesis